MRERIPGEADFALHIGDGSTAQRAIEQAADLGLPLVLAVPSVDGLILRGDVVRIDLGSDDTARAAAIAGAAAVLYPDAVTAAQAAACGVEAVGHDATSVSPPQVLGLVDANGGRT